MLSNLKSEDSANIANEKDSVGGGTVLESALYPVIITMAYLNKSSGGALGLVLTVKTEDDQEVRQTLWMTSGTAKGGKNYYEKDGVKNYLPGYLQANALTLLSIGKEISDMETETKVLNIYSPEAKAEVPTKVEVLMDLLNKPVLIGMLKQTVDKTTKNEATGAYDATGETKEENEIDKIFRASDRMTTAEIRAKAESATFADTWIAKWTGKTRNKAKGVAVGGVAGRPPVGKAASTKPSASLFA